jgi:hypothetical protein
VAPRDARHSIVVLLGPTSASGAQPSLGCVLGLGVQHQTLTGRVQRDQQAQRRPPDEAADNVGGGRWDLVPVTKTAWRPGQSGTSEATTKEEIGPVATQKQRQPTGRHIPGRSKMGRASWPAPSSTGDLIAG